MATPEATKLLMSMTSGRCVGNGRYPEQASILMIRINSPRTRLLELLYPTSIASNLTSLLSSGVSHQSVDAPLNT